MNRNVIAISPLENITQGIDTSLYWKADNNWDLSGRIGFIEESDKAMRTEEYSISPGAGISYINDRIQANFNVDLYKKYTGNLSEKLNTALAIIYDVNNDVHSVLKAEHETSTDPNYSATEVMGNIEIVF